MKTPRSTMAAIAVGDTIPSEPVPHSCPGTARTVARLGLFKVRAWRDRLSVGWLLSKLTWCSFTLSVTLVYAQSHDGNAAIAIIPTAWEYLGLGILLVALMIAAPKQS